MDQKVIGSINITNNVDIITYSITLSITTVLIGKNTGICILDQFLNN